jgi:V8-like Glu-specific endopeptidase
VQGRGLAATVGGILAVVLAGPAFAAAAPAGVSAERPLAGPGSVRDVRAYWTRERMREATPRGATLPRAGATAGGPAAEASADEQPDTTSYPNRVVGRVFFTIQGQGDFSCTGAVINTDTDAFVLTASHCVFESGVFFANFSFMPGYRDGQAPFGEFPATRLAVPEFVTVGQQLPYDHGSAIVAPSSSGRKVEDVVGALGISLFGSPQQSWRAYGYPAEPPFDGEGLYTCDSPTVTLDAEITPPGIGIDCDMAAGASGGPWVIQGTTLVASNTSYTIPDDLPGILFGPQLGDGAAQLLAPAHPVRCGRRFASIVGTEGPDRLVGTSGPDVILGDLGDDLIVARGGKDRLCGEEGKDRLKGGAGKDLCDGGPSKDRAGKCEKTKKL